MLVELVLQDAAAGSDRGGRAIQIEGRRWRLLDEVILVTYDAAFAVQTRRLAKDGY